MAGAWRSRVRFDARAALAVGEALDTTVVNMRFVKPLDTALLEQMAMAHDLLVTVERKRHRGGAGAACAEALAALKLAPAMLHLGLPDKFIDHGDPPSSCPCRGWTRPAFRPRSRAACNKCRFRPEKDRLEQSGRDQLNSE